MAVGKTRPFKRKEREIFSSNDVNASWIAGILTVIAITQVPIALKATLDIACTNKFSQRQMGLISFCEKI